MRRGIDKGYCATVEVTPRIRGRIDLLSSYRRLTQMSGTMQCEFDELTLDTLPNKIIKSTCRLLLVPSSPLTKRNRIQVRLALDQLQGISEIRLSSRSFARVQLHRNNSHYRLLLSVCRLIVECYLPDENESGRRFRSLMDDDRLMNRIFEKFVYSRSLFETLHVATAGIRVSAFRILSGLVSGTRSLIRFCL